jgi:hypothetical protein
MYVNFQHGKVEKKCIQGSLSESVIFLPDVCVYVILRIPFLQILQNIKVFKFNYKLPHTN